MKHIISLGAGVQSSCMALMASEGFITPMPDCAIFADTGAEPQRVYDWLEWLKPSLGFPVHTVMKADGLRQKIVASVAAGRFECVPFFMHRGGMMHRQCTREFKIEPIQKKVRELLGLAPREMGGKEVRVMQWIGISTDECWRMKPSGVAWMANRWPLIELNMSRTDCIAWMRARMFPVPGKSSCTFCPYHDDDYWREARDHDPKSWRDALEIDRLIRGGVRGTIEALYLHRDRKPLDQVDLRTAAEAGQLDLFGNECEGMCGV